MADLRCNIVTDWTCHPVTGDAHEDLPCGKPAEWSGVAGVLACSDCYSEHDAAGRALFSYIDEGATRSESAKEKTMTTQEALDKQRAKVLWCVHVLGPDEVHAMPDYATAEKNVADIAAAIYTPRTATLDVLCLPVVAPWPHSEAAHREDLKRKAWESESDPR